MEELRSSKGFYLMLRQGHVDYKIPQYRCLPGLRVSLKVKRSLGLRFRRRSKGKEYLGRGEKEGQEESWEGKGGKCCINTDQGGETEKWVIDLQAKAMAKCPGHSERTLVAWRGGGVRSQSAETRKHTWHWGDNRRSTGSSAGTAEGWAVSTECVGGHTRGRIWKFGSKRGKHSG